jgi:hypothetical protein
MPVIEQEQIESIVAQAAASGYLQPEKARIMEQFLAQIDDRTRILYVSALTLTGQMYDRQQIAGFWKSQRELFEAQLAIASQLKRKIKPSSGDLPTQQLLLTLDSVIATLEDLIGATSEHYEFHA